MKTRQKYFLRFTLALMLLGLAWIMPAHALLEHAFLYFPTSDQAGTPASRGLAYESVDFQASDGTKLHGWLIGSSTDAPVVLFCMGNYGNKSHRLDNLIELHRLGLNVFIFDYRGYGKSQGEATEQGTYQDVRAAVAWLQKRGWSNDRMVFFGRSLGAGIALQAALEAPPAALILETPFTSIPEMGRTHYWLLYQLVGWLLDARYDNLGKISEIQSPLLIIQGTQDSICPPEMAQTLYEKAHEPKQLYWIEGADHNNTLEIGGTTYWETWQDFLDSSLKQEAGRS